LELVSDIPTQNAYTIVLETFGAWCPGGIHWLGQVRLSR